MKAPDYMLAFLVGAIIGMSVSERPDGGYSSSGGYRSDGGYHSDGGYGSTGGFDGSMAYWCQRFKRTDPACGPDVKKVEKPKSEKKVEKKK